MEKIKHINLWVVYITLYTYSKYGWARLFSTWYGIMWKPVGARLTFSERNGYTKYIIAFGYRFTIIKPIK